MNKKFYLLLFLFILSLQGIAHSEENIIKEELPYNFDSTIAIPLKFSITNNISTKNTPIDGTEIRLRAKENVYYNQTKVLAKGELVTAKIGNIITSGMNGFPAEILLDDFQIKNIKSSQITDVYVKKGSNRCFWVYPLKWSLTLIPFVGSLTNLIKGGHANITTSDTIIIYYYPEWK